MAPSFHDKENFSRFHIDRWAEISDAFRGLMAKDLRKVKLLKQKNLSLNFGICWQIPFLIQIGQSYTQSNNKCSLHKRTMLSVLSESLKSMWCNVIAEMRRNRYEIYVCNVQIVSIPIYDCANFSVYVFLFPHLIRKCDRRDSKQQMGQACGMCTCTKCINKSLLCQKNMCIRPSYP